MAELGSLAKDPGRLTSLMAAIASKSLSPVELVRGCLDRIAAVDGQVAAWVEVDGERALAEARRCEQEALSGKLRGPLHGIPVGVKDVIDVEGLATRCNSRSRADAPPAALDAEIVAAARARGAIVLGKVSTTEYAFFDPPPTRNPHNLSHTPGGSSGGSAAAVASGTVPLTIGTQTFSSVNRPAAYCGIAAFKPTTRSLSTFGVAPLAPYSDTVGFFGWAVEDATAFFDAVRPFHMGRGPAPLPPVPRIALVEDPILADAADEVVQACHRLLARFPKACEAGLRPSPVPLERLGALLKSIMLFELSRVHGGLLRLPPGSVGKNLQDAIEAGAAISASGYLRDRTELADLRQRFYRGLGDVDAFLFPAAPGPAPEGIGSTGDPRYVAPWTALGGPIVTVPAGTSSTGLPLGCVFAGKPGADAFVSALARDLAAGRD